MAGTLPEHYPQLPSCLKYRPESFAAQAARKAIDAFNEFRDIADH